jgi:hypothetical protein
MVVVVACPVVSLGPVVVSLAAGELVVELASAVVTGLVPAAFPLSLEHPAANDAATTSPRTLC